MRTVEFEGEVAVSSRELIITLLVVLFSMATQLRAAKYVVESGDTLTDIASENNRSVDELVKANHISDADLIYVGQQIVLPDGNNLSLVGINILESSTTGLSLSSTIYVNDVLKTMGYSTSPDLPHSPVDGDGYSSNNGRTSYSSLSSAADESASGKRGDCYRTAVRTAHNNGASGNGWSWPSTKKHRGESVRSGLRSAISDKSLKPGMVIYINRNPGTDPASMNLQNLPHWMTYLGKDHNGVDRFSDQYRTTMTVDEAADYYGVSRKIDSFYNPYA